MHYQTLINGDKIPTLGLGTWQNTKHLQPAISAALQAGYRHIDGAAIYLNEASLGIELQKHLSAAGGIARGDLWITSKLWNSYHEPKKVRQACVDTLRDLKLDYLDLYLMHWPVAQQASIGLEHAKQGSDFIATQQLPLAETYAAMQELVDEGLVRNIGVSNFTQSKLQQLINDSGLTPSVNQVELHPYLAQTKLSAFCKQHGIVVTAYSPLGAGNRPLPIQAYQRQHKRLLDEAVIHAQAKLHNATPAQVLIAWNLAQGHVVIPKSSNPERISENFKAQNIQLSAEALSEINKLNCDLRYIDGKFFYLKDSPYQEADFWD